MHRDRTRRPEDPLPRLPREPAPVRRRSRSGRAAGRSLRGPRDSTRARRSPARALPIALAAVVAFVPGCDSLFGPDDSAPRPPEAITDLPRALSEAEVEAISASNAFGFDLLRELAEADPESSIFLSPFSASMALGMTLNGADGETFDAMRHALRFGSLQEEEINAAYRGLLDLLVDLDPDVELAIGNAIWHRDEVILRESFIERVEASFDARVQGLDFGSPGAADVINGWASDATEGRIEEIVEPPIPPQIVAYLMNAVYFDAGWTEVFDPEDTRTAPFHLPDGSTEPVELMTRDDTLRYHGTERYDAVDLPYAGQAFSMSVVVPREGVSVHDLVDELDAEGWRELTEGFRTARAQVWLPRFELEWDDVLNDALGAMGMEVAFGPGADFSRMFENADPWIDEVKQKTFVRVDEEGTEAAAVTSVAMTTSLPPQVRADRPFLFAIRERLSGTILFTGLIVEAPRL